MVIATLALAGCSEPAPVREPENDTVAQLLNEADATPTEAGTPVAVRTDPGASYWIISKAKMPNGNLEVVTRRKGRSGESYSRREVDCKAGTVRYLGEGDTLADAQATSPNLGEMLIPSPQSITGEITSAVCGAVL